MIPFVHPSKFVETVIEMNKDFSSEWIEEMIVSRISPANFPSLIEKLLPHVSSNDPNGAKFAIQQMEKYL